MAVRTRGRSFAAAVTFSLGACCCQYVPAHAGNIIYLNPRRYPAENLDIRAGRPGLLYLACSVARPAR